MTEEERIDRKYMRAALKQAEKAITLGEVPIGCVIVCDGKVIGRGYNRRNTDKSTLSHAEITAIRKASKKLGDWRLEGCTLYCTLEPCPMCAGAIVQARMDRVVIGAASPKSGCGGTLLNILQNDPAQTIRELAEQVIAAMAAANEIPADQRLFIRSLSKSAEESMYPARKKGKNEKVLAIERNSPASVVPM